jgi:hypothetical protein
MDRSGSMSDDWSFFGSGGVTEVLVAEHNAVTRMIESLPIVEGFPVASWYTEVVEAHKQSVITLEEAK